MLFVIQFWSNLFWMVQNYPNFVPYIFHWKKSNIGSIFFICLWNIVKGWSDPRGDLLRSVPWLTLRWKLQILSYFYSFQSFQSIFRLDMMKQYIVKLRKLFSQFYLVFVFLMSQHDNGGFLKIALRRASISKKTSLCIMVINTDD